MIYILAGTSNYLQCAHSALSFETVLTNQLSNTKRKAVKFFNR